MMMKRKRRREEEEAEGRKKESASFECSLQLGLAGRGGAEDMEDKDIRPSAIHPLPVCCPRLFCWVACLPSVVDNCNLLLLGNGWTGDQGEGIIGLSIHPPPPPVLADGRRKSLTAQAGWLLVG